MGLVSNTFFYRWDGFTASLLGALVGLGLLLPFILIRSLGTGDWKLAGALGALTGPGLLIDLLSVFVAGAMAIILIIRRGRIRARRCATSATFWSRSSGSSCPAIACRWIIPSR